MKNKTIKIILAAAGTTAVLAGVTVALWASGDQPKEGMSSYTALKPLHPEELYVDRVVSDPSKPQPTGKYAAEAQNTAGTGAGGVEDGTIRPFAGMTDEQVEATLEQAYRDDPEGADFLIQRWKVYQVMETYQRGVFERDHILCDENKIDVVEAAVELYDGGRLTEADKKTVGLFVYDQISWLAGAESPYYEAADRIVKEIRTQPWFVRDETPAS